MRDGAAATGAGGAGGVGVADSPLAILRATGALYVESAREATRGLIRNWIILPGSLAAFVALQILVGLLSPFGIAGGMVAGMIQIALLSLYYSWLHDTSDRDRLSWRGLLQFDYGMFFTILSVAFIFFIVQFLVRHLIQGMNANEILLFLQLGIVIIFNAIPEVIIVDRMESTPALGQAATFTRENWIEWFLPLVVVTAPLLLLNPYAVLIKLASTEPLLPAMVVAEATITAARFSLGGAGTYLGIALGITLATWFMLFRIHLYRELSSGSRRQRIYRAKQR